jgi:multidrug efflux pump subunit AcrB
MLTDQEISWIAQNVATTTLGSGDSKIGIAAVHTTTATDSQGDPALKITIVLTPGSTELVQGKAVLKTLDQLQQQLQDAGENRFPIVEFETKGELPVAD